MLRNSRHQIIEIVVVVGIKWYDICRVFQRGLLNGGTRVNLSKLFLVGIIPSLTGVRTGCFSCCPVLNKYVARCDLGECIVCQWMGSRDLGGI